MDEPEPGERTHTPIASNNLRGTLVKESLGSLRKDRDLFIPIASGLSGAFDRKLKTRHGDEIDVKLKPTNAVISLALTNHKLWGGSGPLKGLEVASQQRDRESRSGGLSGNQATGKLRAGSNKRGQLAFRSIASGVSRKESLRRASIIAR